jgi:acetylglutamate kinase
MWTIEINRLAREQMHRFVVLGGELVVRQVCNVMYLPADRVRPLGITMAQAMAIVKRMGVGSANVLRGADLTLPADA